MNQKPRKHSCLLGSNFLKEIYAWTN